MQLLLRSAGELALTGVFLFAHLEVGVKRKTMRGMAFPAENLTGKPSTRKTGGSVRHSGGGTMPS